MKMRVVVDANVLFACIISRKYSFSILLDSRIEVFAPDFIFEEVLKYKKYLLNKSKFSDIELDQFIEYIRRRITIINSNELTDHYSQAAKISPDPKDEAYFALALKLKIPIWSNDKELKKQKRIKVFTTDELM